MAHLDRAAMKQHHVWQRGGNPAIRSHRVTLQNPRGGGVDQLRRERREARREGAGGEAEPRGPFAALGGAGRIVHVAPLQQLAAGGGRGRRRAWSGGGGVAS